MNLINKPYQDVYNQKIIMLEKCSTSNFNSDVVSKFNITNDQTNIFCPNKDYSGTINYSSYTNDTTVKNYIRLQAA